MSSVPSLAVRVYHLFLRAYPSEYAETFGNEMAGTFCEGAEDTRSQDTLASFLFREFREMPRALVKAYWHGLRKKFQTGIHALQEATSLSDLPAPPADGRQSWRQASLEVSIFLLTGLLLILVTYLPFDGLGAGWQRDFGFLGRIIVPLTLPVFLSGLLRGLPRWAYPFGGLLLGYYVISADRSGLWPFLIVMGIAFAILGTVALFTSPKPSLLPISVRRIAQSLTLDWTRLSFGLYGTMPLGILMAYDDAHTNSRTPYLVLSVLGMVAGALVYARSRRRTVQIAALLAGMTLSIWPALLDKAVFAANLADWIAAPYPGPAEIVWTLQFWVTWVFLIMFPALLITVNHAFQSEGAI